MRIIPPIFLLIFLAACTFKIHPNRSFSEEYQENGEEKYFPNEYLGQQRAWPERELNWADYHRAAENIQQIFAAKSADPCTGYQPKWTLEGPTNIAGRVNTLVVQPSNENVLLAGFSQGGIFKTTDGGDSWRPVFENHLNLSIGTLKFDPSDDNIIYCGTGDPNVPGTLFNGSGIFKSTDAGENWQFLGLADAGIITKIAVDPTNSQVFFAAAMGNPFQRNQQRGIFKSTDGGQNWQRVLFVAEQAGASDLQMNPLNTNELYASFWDRIRTNTESTAFGPNAKIFKTTDGGANWQQLTNGLPTGKWSRTGLVMSQQNPEKLYAVFVDTTYSKPSVFKTDDGGASWQNIPAAGLNLALGGFGWYFAKMRLHPTNDEELYFLGTQIYRRAAGASQFGIFGGMHADVHDFLLTPGGKKFSGTDGGVYRNVPGQNPWTRLKIPTTQFYHTNFNRFDQKWYGGAQDNGVSKGTSQTLAAWEAVLPNDGFSMQFHQTDPLQMWGTTQNGVVWTSTNGGQNFDQTGECLGFSNDRCNWDTPILSGQHASNQKLYAATYRVYETDGNGGSPSFGAISGDLTDGVIFGDRFHTISCLSESPLVPGKLMAGTTDGNVWRREPNGNWFNLTSTLPNRYVTSVKMSPTLAARLFTTHSGWRNNEYIPHIHRSDDNGATWQDISADLPNFPVNEILILPNRKDSVLVAATDVGVYFSKNYGTTWNRVGQNLPNVPCFDLDLDNINKKIGIGTYARGIWTIKIDSMLAQTNAVFFHANGFVKNEAGKGIAHVNILGEKTDTTGRFFIQNLNACQSFELKPFRNDSFLNGVTTFDLLLISKHVLGVLPFSSPIQSLAADANNSKTVTTNDIVTLRKLILGIDSVLEKRHSWDFLPKNYQFQNPGNPFLDSIPNSFLIDYQNSSSLVPDFLGYKIGDLNNSAWLGFSKSDDRTAEDFPIFFEMKNENPDGTVEVIFSTKNEDWAAMQFTLEFDPTAANLLEIKNLRPDFGMENFNLNKKVEGKISVAVERNFSENQFSNLFSAIFKMKKPGNVISTLKLSSKLTAAAVFKNDGTAMNPILQKKSTQNLPSKNVVCLQNLVGENGTAFQFSGFEKEVVDFQIIDNQGKTLVFRKINLPGGEFRQVILRNEFSAAGVCFWKIEAENGQVFSGKIIKN